MREESASKTPHMHAHTHTKISRGRQELGRARQGHRPARCGCQPRSPAPRLLLFAYYAPPGAQGTVSAL